MAEHCKKVIIVGAGIAGLCTGVYARKSGFDVEIVEMGHSSGGLATSWQRNGYTFETCIHWLLGSNPTGPYHALWKEVFNIQRIDFINLEEIARIETEDGQHLVIKRNIDAIEHELLRIAPEDRVAITRLAKGIRKLMNCKLPLMSGRSLTNLAGLLRLVPYLSEIRYWSKMTTEQLGNQFQHPLLRSYFGGNATPQMSAATVIFSLAWMCNHDAGYPIGGSQALIKLIEQNFRDLGGKIHFNAKVDRIIIEHDKAVGVRLADQSEIRGDWVVSAADGHATLFEWIPDRYRNEIAEKPYRNLPVFPSYLQVSLGVKRDMRQEPAYLTLILNTPLKLDPVSDLKELSIRFFHFDPTFAPTGKTAVTCFLPTYNYDYWVNLHNGDPVSYANKKQEVAMKVIEILERRLPGLRNDIEVIDVSTPVSVIRHTGNWKGSMEGFQLTPQPGFRPLSNTLPKLKNLMMVGQWVMPGGGLPSGLMTGRRCVQEICKAEQQTFRTWSLNAVDKQNENLDSAN